MCVVLSAWGSFKKFKRLSITYRGLQCLQSMQHIVHYTCSITRDCLQAPYRFRHAQLASLKSLLQAKANAGAYVPLLTSGLWETTLVRKPSCFWSTMPEKQGTIIFGDCPALGQDTS